MIDAKEAAQAQEDSHRSSELVGCGCGLLALIGLTLFMWFLIWKLSPHLLPEWLHP